MLADEATFSFETDTVSTTDDDFWDTNVLLLLTTLAEVLEDATVVELLTADVTEEATVVTEDAAWTTEDCTRDAKEPKKEPISEMPSVIEPDDGLAPDEGLSCAPSSGLVETVLPLLEEPLE